VSRPDLVTRSPVGRGGSLWRHRNLHAPVIRRCRCCRLSLSRRREVAVPVTFQITTPPPEEEWTWCPGLLWLWGIGIVVVRVALSQAWLALVWHRDAVRDELLLTRVRLLARRLGVRRRSRIVGSPQLTGPMTFGMFRPVNHRRGGQPGAFGGSRRTPFPRRDRRPRNSRCRGRFLSESAQRPKPAAHWNDRTVTHLESALAAVRARA
jgi:hypothetical protein